MNENEDVVKDCEDGTKYISKSNGDMVIIDNEHRITKKPTGELILVMTDG